MKLARNIVGIVSLVIVAAALHAADAPVTQVSGWRGDGTGCFPNADPVLDWGLNPKKNIKWATVVGPSHSSPIVAGDRVFVTAEPDKLLCLDKADGKILWTRSSAFEDLPKDVASKIDADKREPHTEAGYATPTPVTDGKRVFVYFGTSIAACYDLAGERKWIVFLDYQQPVSEGRAVSPILAGGQLILQPDPLVAISPDTGKVIWATPSEKIPGSYGTSVVGKMGETPVLITPTGDVVRLSDGKILVQEIGKVFFPSPIIKDNVVYFITDTSSAIPLPTKAADTMKANDFPERWSTTLAQGFFASPVIHDGLIYAVSNNAEYLVLDAAKGDIVIRKPLKLLDTGKKPKPQMYPSVSIAGKHVFISNDAGDTVILALGREFKEVARIRFGDGSAATPIFDGANIFLRGDKTLYCVGK
jgi:hypothetical protein